MQIKLKDVRVGQGDSVDLKAWPTRLTAIDMTKQTSKEMLAAQTVRLSDLQQLLFAANRQAVLIIFQAMDAAGKDGAIKHVMSGVNPQGCDVFSYSHPSAAELQHDFLWRTTRDLPARGKIGIFNRSYYEEVLIVRVQPEILAAEAVPEGAAKKSRIWHDRFKSIVDFEGHLHRNGTQIIKIFLHVSKSEQRIRLLERIDNPQKNWKITPADLEARKNWKHYRRAYEDCIAATTTREVPWYIVPADDKPTARLIVSQIILETLADLNLSLPEPSAQRLRDLQAMRAQLEGE